MKSLPPKPKSGLLPRSNRLKIFQGFQQNLFQTQCAASWQAQVVPISTPLDSCNYQSHILNISLSTPQSIDAVVTCYAGPLMVLADKMRAGFNAV
ncbi:hypothetical protein [Pseudomonas sp. MWU12-3103b]|uniref:hypothetical protein n=1 Tax=Pseudomonas sp. MWU12-3103b TaxID=2928857 RepID=UPI001FFE32C4|nr:hypothetical protein [Pseudomonas sp. MWU12-3103b]